MTSRPAGFGLVAGIILAGGLSRRMGGGDKSLRSLAGQPVLAHVIGRVAPQVDALAINANGDPGRFSEFKLDVVADSVPGFVGPLAGVLAGMDWAIQKVSGATHVVSVPGDGPFLPLDLVHRLISAAFEANLPLATASSGGFTHPVVGLWPLALRDDLHEALAVEGIRKVDIWTAKHGIAIAEYSTQPIDPFFNANTPEEIDEAEKLFRSLTSES